MSLRLPQSTAAAALALLLAGPGSGEEPAEPPSNVQAAAQRLRPSSGPRVELFARGVLSLLHVAAEDALAPAAGAEGSGAGLSEADFLAGFGLGAGARVMAGVWGIEASYTSVESLALAPAWLAAQGRGEDPQEFPFVDSRADLWMGQFVGAAMFPGSLIEGSVGVGAGWMRVRGTAAERLYTRDPEFGFSPGRSSLVYAGSMAVAARVGPTILRPRLDVVVSRSLTTELRAPGPNPGSRGGSALRVGADVVHTIFVLSVEIGFSS